MTLATAAGRDIWMYDLGQRTTTRITSDGVSSLPVWTADGLAILYSRDGVLYRLRADGSREADKILQTDYSLTANAVSADGRLLFYTSTSTANKTDIWVAQLESEGSLTEPTPVLETAAEEIFAAISPDGKWLAYTSDETGGWEVYARAFPGPGAKHRISIDGGEEPRWSPDGSELYYRFGSRWFVARVVAGESFSVLRPEVLFEGPYMNVPYYSYDLSPDGQRFLVVEGPEHTGELTDLTVTTNALELLERQE